MEQQSEQRWSFTDKTAWPRGPWDDEPDKVQWIDPATGLDCLIHRGPGSALCGYVGLPPGHKFHGKDYDEVTVYDDDYRSTPSVHGGLTFADSCSTEERTDGGGICHIPAPGRPADVWWLGFDCAHSGDLSPGVKGLDSCGMYRGLAYVKREVTALAQQLAEAA